MRKINQQGFSAVETLLIILIMIVIGFAGWYIGNANKDKNSNTNAKQTASSATTTPKQEVFKIPELGVQFPLPNDLKELTYKAQSSSEANSQILTTPEFSALAQKCGGDISEIGFANLFKKTGTYITGPAEGELGVLKQFDGYYITGGDPLYGLPCDQTVYDQLASMQGKLNRALATAFRSATKIN